jgi:hypothetical protein
MGEDQGTEKVNVFTAGRITSEQPVICELSKGFPTGSDRFRPCRLSVLIVLRK